MNWNLISKQVPQSLDELKNILLKTRDIKNKEGFFNLKSPFDFSLKELEIDKKEVQKALKLILKTKKDKKNILVFGDYDADGICATAIVWQVLHNMGCKVLPFIPHREKHGYGLSHKAIDEILSQEKKPDLIITVDNGIVAHSEVQRLVDEGIRVIITDHHQVEDKLPTANAIVVTTKLCGASVAWILMRELTNSAVSMEAQLDLCGIATVADQVKLRGANRAFARFGIEALRKTQRPGLLELFQEAQINQQDIDTYHINYVIAPRINAMGRLEHGLDALRLLVAKSAAKSQALAQKLSEVNKKRQDITQIALESASNNYKKWQDEKIIIVSSSDYHEGVIGLIAGKLVDQFYKPAIAMSLGEGLVKGSARSISGFNITELLREIKSDLLSVGGHPMAAGFSADIKNLEVLSSKLKKLAQEQLDSNLLERSLKLEVEIPTDLLSEEFVSLVDEFSPFGQGNRKPIFLIKNAQVIDFKTMGRENNHLLLNVKSPSPNDKYFKCIAWRMGERISELSPGDSIDIAGMVEINQWRDRRNLQVVVRDFRTENDYPEF